MRHADAAYRAGEMGDGMRLPRPRVPISVKIEVALLQLRDPETNALRLAPIMRNKTKRLNWILTEIFGNVPTVHLDHDPPLAARKFYPRSGRYKPAANDPKYLIFRTVEDHRIKTFVRGEHGQYSDRVLIKREKRRNAQLHRQRSRLRSR